MQPANTEASEFWIRKLALQPHPEGGFYREVFRSEREVSTAIGKRSGSTSIYFLLTANSFSALHRIAFDESWYFHTGSDIEIVQLDGSGALEIHRLGMSARASGWQAHIEGGAWFGARLAEPTGPDDYALVGCAVAPGFDFRDFEMGDRNELLRTFPQHRQIIEEMTR